MLFIFPVSYFYTHDSIVDIVHRCPHTRSRSKIFCTSSPPVVPHWISCTNYHFTLLQPIFITNVFDIFAYEQFLNAVVVFQKGASKYLKSKFVGESIYVLPTPPPSMRRRGVRDDLHVSLIRRGAIAQQFGMNIRFRKK